MVFPVAAALGIGTSIIGGIMGGSQQNAARRAEQERIDQQYRYDMQMYRYSNRETNRNYRFRLKETANQRQFNEQSLTFQEQSALNDYGYGLAIRDFDHQLQMRQYRESEKIYGQQLGFNQLAAMSARDSEERQLTEIMAGMAFDSQDLMVKMLQEEGQLEALGTSGKSTAKALASAIAGYGRNQAILAENLSSARRETNSNLRDIDLRKQEADMNAQARRMLQPVKGPDPLAPLRMPRAKILDPLKPKKPPLPLKGTNTVPGASGLTIASNIATGALGALSSAYNPSTRSFS